VPSAANPSTTALLLLGLLVGGAAWPAPAHAQHVEGARTVVVPLSTLERELQSEIICMCGTCGRQRIAECTCSLAAGMRAELATLMAQGKTREQVYQYFIDKHGSQEPLAMPIDRGFNRLAWAVPYAVGIFGALLAGATAFRWSRERPRPEPSRVATGPGEDALQARLDEELRDLD